MVTKAKQDTGELILTCFLAGLLPGLSSPLLWPLMTYVQSGHYPETTIVSLTAISIFGAIYGVATSSILGTPILWWIRSQGYRSNLLVGLVGGALAFLIFAVLAATGDAEWSGSIWPFAAFVVVNGASCGWLASWLANHNKSLKADAANGAA